MPVIEIDGVLYQVDQDGFLVNPEDWAVDFARHVAASFGFCFSTNCRKGMSLGCDHEGLWHAVGFCRSYYQEREQFPASSLVAWNVKAQLGFANDSPGNRFVEEVLKKPSREFVLFLARAAGVPRNKVREY